MLFTMSKVKWQYSNSAITLYRWGSPTCSPIKTQSCINTVVTLDIWAASGSEIKGGGGWSTEGAQGLLQNLNLPESQLQFCSSPWLMTNQTQVLAGNSGFCGQRNLQHFSSHLPCRKGFYFPASQDCSSPKDKNFSPYWLRKRRAKGQRMGANHQLHCI